MDSIIRDKIQSLNDTDQLTAIITLAQERLEYLRSKPAIYLVVKNGNWYAVQNKDNPELRQVVLLGRRLPPAEVLARARKAAPTPLDFEIDKVEADRRRMTSREHIGWVEEPVGKIGINRRYYSVPDYDKALTAYRRWRDLAMNPLAMAYGLTVEAMEKIVRWETAGHTIISLEAQGDNGPLTS
ncbi:MAG: hypothetical protein KC415_21645 [Anaerolineales bacterium]|nr:hypothetical protein [Anaerolineales bacterium]MCB8991812.1 hypothetical protein [Ardenticatenaceae bacterium]